MKNLQHDDFKGPGKHNEITAKDKTHQSLTCTIYLSISFWLNPVLKQN